MNAIKLFVFFAFAAFFGGCINHDVPLPKGYLNHSQMVPIMVDMHLIEGARSGKLVLGDTNRLPDYYSKIYIKHNTTQEQFKTSLDWYTKNPEKLKLIYEDLIVELSKKEAEIRSKGVPKEESDDYEEE